MLVTPNLGLRVWNLPSDPYNHDELADNWIKLDRHDHTGGPRGIQIGTNALADGSVTREKIATGAVDAISISNGYITNAMLGGGIVQSSNIATNAVGDSQLQSAVKLPVGAITLWAAPAAPTGWLICDGLSVATATYPLLQTAIGYVYGGAGANFNLPDLRGRVPVGPSGLSGNITSLNTLAASGGNESHTLTAGEIPAHSHTATATAHVDDTAGAQANRLSRGGSHDPQDTTGAVAVAVANNTGGGGGHTSLQPYLVLNYIIRHGS